MTNSGYTFGLATIGPDLGCPVIGNDGMVYLVSIAESKLYAFSPSNAQTTNWSPEWSIDVDGGGSHTFGRLTVGKDGLIYVGANNYLFTVDPNGPSKATLIGGFGNNISSELAIGTTGTVYFSTTRKLFAINSSSGGLADSAWPMFQQNLRRTGRAQ